jgi:hypothetical protein
VVQTIRLLRQTLNSDCNKPLSAINLNIGPPVRILCVCQFSHFAAGLRLVRFGRVQIIFEKMAKFFTCGGTGAKCFTHVSKITQMNIRQKKWNFIHVGRAKRQNSKFCMARLQSI